MQECDVGVPSIQISKSPAHGDKKPPHVLCPLLCEFLDHYKLVSLF